MNPEKLFFESSVGEGCRIAAFFSPCSGQPKGLIQICHGMADYFGRYEEMVDTFNAAGWHVCGMDMPGHGQTYYLNKDLDMPLGFFGSRSDSAVCILKDEMKLHSLMLEKPGMKGLPMVLLGHSMGSFVARNIYITPEYAPEFDAFVFCSTMGKEPAVGFGIVLARIAAVFGMKRRPGKLQESISFGTYNKKISNPKTHFDWVCSDEAVVAAYCADPLAGFSFTCKGFYDLFKLVARMQRGAAYRDLPGKPCLLTYAMDDPVSGYGKGAQSVADKLAAAGADVTVKNYGHVRHEIHNESIKGKLFEDILQFCNEKTLRGNT